MFKNTLYAILCSCFLFACGGSDSGSGEAKTEKFLNQFQGGACGLKVVSDYNDVVFQCDVTWMKEDSDVTDCKLKAQSFIDKYPGINCKAKKRSEISVNDDDLWITEEKIQTVIDKLEAAGA